MEDDEDGDRWWPGIDVDSLETLLRSREGLRKDADPFASNRGNQLRSLGVRAERKAAGTARGQPLYLGELPHRSVETHEVVARDFMRVDPTAAEPTLDVTA